MVTEPAAADLAREAARRLAAELDPNLPALTERALAEGPAPAPVLRSFDAGTSIALAALILGAAQFAWAIYRDLKKDRKERREPARADRDLLLRRLRLKLGQTSGITGAHRDRVFEVIVDEVLVRGRDA